MVACRYMRSSLLHHLKATTTSLLFFAALCCFARGHAQTWHADNGDGTYSNPLFYDEFSDPDMIRVGSDFYLTGTTMHSMPGLPILHSKDLVNWDFVTYALDKLDLGPEYRLEDGRSIYGQGIWAPSFRYHNGTYYIFSNVNGKTTQLFQATSPAGPWTRKPMTQSLHDLSVLFDDDGKAYAVWGYRAIHLAQLTDDLTDIVPGSEQQIINPDQGMGEGLHLYKIKGKYILTSAWYVGEERMPTARADKLTGPWEVNQNVSRGEDFGLVKGHGMNPGPRRDGSIKPPYKITPPNPETMGRVAIHQGGILDTPTGEWWGFSMQDANAIGRLLSISPVTWTDGWPYFGLPGNLGRTPRTWLKPNTGTTSAVHAPYVRNDDFSGPKLANIWQWNHVPVDGKWSLTERPGYLRLHAMPATELRAAKNTLTQRAIGPQSTPTTVLDTKGMATGDTAGLALFNFPNAWIGVTKTDTGQSITVSDEQAPGPVSEPLQSNRVWLRATCDYRKETAQFSYSTNGKDFRNLGAPVTLVYQIITFQGIRYSLFSYNSAGKPVSGYADFDDFTVNEPAPRANMQPIPYGKSIALQTFGLAATSGISLKGAAPAMTPTATGHIEVRRAGPGRIQLCSQNRCLHVDEAGATTMQAGKPASGNTFQWITSLTGELTLMSLQNHRYLRADAATGKLIADSPGPRPNATDGARFTWHTTNK
ncbi:beta-xylosidase [Terriglobus roseus DSM 18391]|uniref:Beta-xylosidase n=1 Tax=Terriglobus roseus (strain DSM 18391 / NRRL B-41598 / KBS 63) TaxID=926566 RepID=I3ZFR2_TERRK|nr:glycoside hydrolase 43 family protein [Terriglobus roseus]AFL88080.1 beta-xylosidase [Terriglobus roseus DSM 18391]